MRVVTWNIWGRWGDFEGRYPGIVRTLASQSADVVGLVEIWWNDEDDQIAQLAADLGYDHWAKAELGIVDDATWGVGVLSRFPIRDDERLAFENPLQDQPPGVAVVATVEGPDGAFDFVSLCEWSDSWSGIGADAVGDRLWAFQALGARLLERGRSLPPIIVGDFNAVPEQHEIRALTGKEPQIKMPMTFFDCWEYVQGWQGGFTLDGIFNSHLAEEAFGRHRIDFIMAGAGLSFEQLWKPVEAEVFGQGSGPVGPPSDHYGVRVQLELAKPNVPPSYNHEVIR